MLSHGSFSRIAPSAVILAIPLALTLLALALPVQAEHVVIASNVDICATSLPSWEFSAQANCAQPGSRCDLSVTSGLPAACDGVPVRLSAQSDVELPILVDCTGIAARKVGSVVIGSASCVPATTPL